MQRCYASKMRIPKAAGYGSFLIYEYTNNPSIPIKRHCEHCIWRAAPGFQIFHEEWSRVSLPYVFAAWILVTTAAKLGIYKYIYVYIYNSWKKVGFLATCYYR